MSFEELVLHIKSSKAELLSAMSSGDQGTGLASQSQPTVIPHAFVKRYTGGKINVEFEDEHFKHAYIEKYTSATLQHKLIKDAAAEGLSYVCEKDGGMED